MTAFSRRQVALLAILALVAVAGCSPPPEPPPTLTLRLSTTPSMRPAAAALAEAYGGPERHVEVTVEERSDEEGLAAVAAGLADLALIEGRPEEAELLNPEDRRPWLRVWPLAVDQVAIVVNPANPVSELEGAQLRRMFEGLERSWAELGGADEPVRLVSREPGSPAATVFAAAILADTRLAGSAVIRPGDQAVRDYVAAHPGAIGYLSLAWADETVRVIALDGVRPAPGEVAADAYPLTHPVVAVTRLGPAGEVRAFLDFCRRPEGREVLGQLYALLP